jgi:sterol desaturase/sphingolipid hydroxylase (fatty acid hydroxylase superfamily)
VSARVASALASYRPIEGSFEAYKREQSRVARRRLYPLTVFYTTYSLIVALFAVRSGHPWIGMAFYLAGIAVWTLVEYLFHRYVLHGRFPSGKGLIRRFLHERLDPLHWEHHERPFDGLHISGELKDILPLFFVAAPFSFLFPVYTLPALLAGVVQGYVGEEWLHYFLHFGRFRNRYFRHLKRYHLYHHSPRGMGKGYGITSGIWDLVFHTQYPTRVRKSLSGSEGGGVPIRKMTRSDASRLFRERFRNL